MGIERLLIGESAAFRMEMCYAPRTRIMNGDGRKIIHLDMDCFYAAVEMRERPELAGMPIAVGGGTHRGVVTTCNYEAREFGVRSAMPGFRARELCPHLVFLPVRFDLYRRDSATIRKILLTYTPLVEPLSLDEAYLDVSGLGRFAWDLAKEIRAKIFSETKLTSSAGIAPNKMLAKIASEWRKPNGQFAITPDAISEFMRDLPVRKILGVGPKSAARLEAMGLPTCGDLQKLSPPELAGHFGRWGEELFLRCRGIDDRAVVADRPRKSLSNESTFLENLGPLAECKRALEPMIGELIDELRTKASGRTIRKCFVKVKFADFLRTTCECVCSEPTSQIFQSLLAAARSRSSKSVRLLGVGVRFADDAEENAQTVMDF